MFQQNFGLQKTRYYTKDQKGQPHGSTRKSVSVNPEGSKTICTNISNAID